MNNKTGIKNMPLPTSPAFHHESVGISNLDGRLWDEVGFDTGRHFSDIALIRGRVAVEAQYIIHLSKAGVIRKLSAKEVKTLSGLHEKIDLKAYKRFRAIESKARHDVISMTKLMQELLAKNKGLADIVSHGWVHWGLASEDVDNIARSLLIKNFLENVYLPTSAKLLTSLANLAKKTRSDIIPGKTHLQTAVPTSLGKEIALFGERLGEKLLKIKKSKLRAKLTGATGNLSPHKLVYPKVNWIKFSKNFVSSLGLEPNVYTTQVEPKNNLVELFSDLAAINSILIDLSQDMRIYIGFDWLSQVANKSEFGSSAMPQKVNPIDFENAHGNALMASWILEGLIRHLPTSWLQRDLSDKTIQRNLGLPFGYSLITLLSTQKGIERVSPNREVVKATLNNDWGIIAEGVQTYLRAQVLGDAYDKAKEFFRGRLISKDQYLTWVENAGLTPKDKKVLEKLSPANYTGYSERNCQQMVSRIQSVSKKLQ